MKFINIAFTLLFTSSANAASINREFDEQVQSSLRKSNRNVPGSSEDWLNALNAVRQAVIDDAVTLDDDYSLLEWSADLAAEAQTWANSLAAKCQNGVPDGSQNPGDYGVNTVLNMRNPVNTVDRWVTNGAFDALYYLLLCFTSLTLVLSLLIIRTERRQNPISSIQPHDPNPLGRNQIRRLCRCNLQTIRDGLHIIGMLLWSCWKLCLEQV